MVKLFIDFIQFLYTLAPLLMALGVLTLLAVLLSKSIKKHATVYYTVFAIPFALVAIPFIGRLFGVQISIFNGIPFLGSIMRDYIHAGTLGFPLLIIIMYMGALNPKYPIVKKLFSIRKELSILSGFPILTHSLIRTTVNFPRALNYFFDSEASGRAVSALGAGISNFSFVLGILMLALFIPLWVTSFDSAHKRMGGARWKKLQRWSYVLYAMLFIHAMGIQVGSMLNPRGGREAPPIVEVTATIAEPVPTEQPVRSNRRNPELQGSAERSGRGDRNAVQPAADSTTRTEVARPASGRQQSQGFADITVSAQAKRHIHIASLLLIFGSYLYLRMRKAKLKKQHNQ
jgi:DMSO/TMAO reductase YedYZ heme-binding membrane subunit